MRDFIGFVFHALGNKIQGRKVTFAETKKIEAARNDKQAKYCVF